MGHTIHHKGVVERTEQGRVFVRVEKESACAGCHAKGLCGESGSERIIEVRTPYAEEYATGDRVVVALERGSMGAMSVVWAYVLPLVVLLVVLFGAHGLGFSDGVSALASIVSVALYYVVLRVARGYFDRKIKFTIIKE